MGFNGKEQEMEILLFLGGVVLLSIVVVIVASVSAVTAAVAGEVEDQED